LLTLTELKEKVVEQMSEFDVVDLLGLTTEDIVNAFEDKLLAKYNYLINELELSGSNDFDNEDDEYLD
jgi:hypothetical protein